MAYEQRDDQDRAIESVPCGTETMCVNECEMLYKVSGDYVAIRIPQSEMPSWSGDLTRAISGRACVTSKAL